MMGWNGMPWGNGKLLHFSKTSRETMSDKIKCMMKNEIRQV